MILSRSVWMLLCASALMAQPAMQSWRPVFPRESTDRSAGKWQARPPLWTRGRYFVWPELGFMWPGVTSTTGAPYVTPSQMRSAYGATLIYYPSTIAIVDAYDSPSAEADLGVFSSAYGLPACTTANGCFTKVNQRGARSYPRRNTGWESEINLDVQWAHAMAPNSKILLVEANSASDADLFAAVNYAKQHAAVVSMSWSGPEWSGQSYYDAAVFTQSHVTFLAASGDTAGEIGYPSTSANVIAVGGTSFATNSQGYVILPVIETAWSNYYGGSGGGCSAYTPQPAFQKSWAAPDCQTRGVPDVSMDADPASGVLVYISRQGGWWIYGGTSLSCPMMAGLIADVNGYRSYTLGKMANPPLGLALPDLYSAASYNYALYFNDIKKGGDPYAASPRWDMVTGLGSPKAGGLMQYLISSKAQ